MEIVVEQTITIQELKKSVLQKVFTILTSTSKVLRSCSSQVVNERFKKYSMLPNELLTFETTNFKNIK